jgi:hypothetical protein
MDKASIVPNQFFDLIARVIPGGVLVFAFALMYGPALINDLIGAFVPAQLGEEWVPWLVVSIGVTYALGHALSPLVKALDSVGKRWRRRSSAKEKKYAPLFDDMTARYNALRFHYPTRIIYATRIRAESTMYGGIASAIAVAEFVALTQWLGGGAAVASLTVCAIGLVVMAGMVYRYYDVQLRFCETIAAFEREARKAR